jgi:hypothetical protein
VPRVYIILGHVNQQPDTRAKHDTGVRVESISAVSDSRIQTSNFCRWIEVVFPFQTWL